MAVAVVVVVTVVVAVVVVVVVVVVEDRVVVLSRLPAMPKIHSPHIIAFVGWLIGWMLLWRVPRLQRARHERQDEPENVTVVIPARNEAHRIRPLLDSLEKNLVPKMKVIVVDDHSEDDTAKVAGAYPFVRVLPAPDLPDDWLGKPWACDSGARNAPPGVLVFLDADIWLESEDGLAHALETWRQQGGLVSIYPHARLKHPYEHLSMYLHVISMMGVRCGGLIPARRVPGAIGTMLVTSTEDYERTGGFRAARHDVIEDFALARAYQDEGLPVRVYGGREDASQRMYPDGMRGLCQGWLKTIGGGAGRLPPVLIGAIVLWCVCAIGGLKWVHGPLRWEAGVLYVLFAAQIYVMARQVGQYSLLAALLYPVILLFTAGLFATSLFKTFFTKKVTWRERTIDLKTAKQNSER